MGFERTWERWPLGSVITYALSGLPTVEIVRAHIVSTWLGSNNPWLGIAGEIVSAAEQDDNNLEDYDRYVQHAAQVVAGEMPPWAKCQIHCVDHGCGGPDFVWPIRQVRVATLSRDVMAMAWPMWYWILRDQDPGDSSVGLYGGTVYHSPYGVGVTGYPELPAGETRLVEVYEEGRSLTTDFSPEVKKLGAQLELLFEAVLVNKEDDECLE